MATLVNLCLENRIDLPTYRVYSEEVCLFLKAGPMFGERMKTLLTSFDAYLADRLGGELTEEQKLVLAYLMKAEWANEQHHYTILLTPDNNHFDQLVALERARLLFKHERSTAVQPIYVVDRVLMQTDYRIELETLFGDIGGIQPLARRCLDILWRHGKFSSARSVTARQAAFALWFADKGGLQTIREFDGFYRKVKTSFNKLDAGGYIVRVGEGSRGFVLNQAFRKEHLL